MGHFLSEGMREKARVRRTILQCMFLCPVLLLIFSGTVLSEEASKKSVTDENLVVFLADSHVGPEAPKADRSKNNNAQFAEACRQILSLRPRPAAVIFAGDLSLGSGEKEDYLWAKPFLTQFESAGIPFYFLFGNHDNRDNIYSVFPQFQQKNPQLAGRLVRKLVMQRADFLLLDSGAEADKKTLGTEQIQWVKKELDGYKKTNKPVFIVSHYPPEELGLPEICQEIPSLKACIYAHQHQFRDNIKSKPATLGLQSSAYTADKSKHYGFSYMKMDRWEFVLRPVTFNPDDVWSRRPIVFKISPNEVQR